MENVGRLEDVLSQVDGSLQIFHNHCPSVQAVVRPGVCREDEPDDGVSCYLGLHLCCGTNDRSRAFCKFHVIGGMGVPVDVIPGRVSDAG